MQLDTPVCLRSMKKKCHADVGYVSGDQDEKDRLPPIRSPASKVRHCQSRLIVVPRTCSEGNLPEWRSGRQPGITSSLGAVDYWTVHHPSCRSRDSSQAPRGLAT